MRPVRVEMVGFSAFREATVVDFEGADLVALVGPTGSGKSSIIDAVTFALYGTVSRYGDARLVEPVIHQLCTEARVRLDFELSGQRYTAVRVVRRTKNGATTKEARLLHQPADPDDEAEGEVLAAGAKEVSEAVRALLGLDFDQFTRTVVLPQGDFATFLREDKKNRQQLLRQLLEVQVYEQMGQLARQRSKRDEERTSWLNEQLDALAPTSDGELATLVARERALLALQATVAEHAEVVARLEADLVAAQADRARIAAALTALDGLAVPAAVASLATDLAAAEAAAGTASTALDQARSARDEAQAALDAGPDAAALRAQLDRLADHARLVAEVDELVPQAEAAEAAVAGADAAAVSTRAALDQADEVAARVKEVAGAQSLVAALVVGEPCPVCRQVVGDLPDHDVAEELLVAIADQRAAKAAHDAAAATAVSAGRALATLVAQLDSRRNARDDLAAKLDPSLDPTVDVATATADLERADELRRAVAETAGAAAEAERGQRTALATVDGLRRQEADQRRAYTEARDASAALGPPAPAGGSLHVDWVALVEWSAEQVVALRAEAEAVEAAEVAARTALGAEQQAVAEACAPLGVEPALRGLGERVATAAANAAHAVARATEQREQAAALSQQVTELAARVALHAEMGRLLSVVGFERWLLQEALDDLVLRATDRLLELSAGRFSLESDDGDFWIRYHRNADERRSVRSLSGGETFLASLALALALAENVAELAVEGGPRLESMFLDEGFGTLDGETLDIVAAAMEELSATGRLICIVTHIRDLADRMPVRFEVSRDATTAHVARVET